MAVAGNLLINVSASTLDLNNKLDGAIRAIKGFKGHTINISQQSSSGFGKMAVAAGVAGAAVLGIKKAFDVVKSATSSAIGIAKSALGKFADFQTISTSFEVLLGSAAKAKKVLADLVGLSNRTPLDPQEVQDAGRKLLAFGEGADTVADTLRKIGDIATGTGNRIGEIAEIYGKARVQGRLFAEDINQLTGRGIPIIGALANVLGVTDGEVKQMVSDGKVGFAELEKAFHNLTAAGGKFEGMMDRQSGTINGLISTIKGSLNQALTLLGQKMVEAFDITGILKGVATAMMGVIDVLSQMVGETKRQETATVDWTETTLSSASGIAKAFATVADIVHKAWAGLQIAVNDMISSMAGMIIELLDMVQGVASSIGMGDAVQGANDFLKAFKSDLDQRTLDTAAGAMGSLAQSVDDFFNKVRDSIKKVAEPVEVPEPLPPSKQKEDPGTGGFGGILAIGLQQAAAVLTNLPAKIQTASDKLAASMEIGGQDTESAITKALQGDKQDIAKRQLEQQKKIADATKQIQQNMKNGVGLGPANLGGAA